MRVDSVYIDFRFFSRNEKFQNDAVLNFPIFFSKPCIFSANNYVKHMRNRSISLSNMINEKKFVIVPVYMPTISCCPKKLMAETGQIFLSASNRTDVSDDTNRG